MRLPSWSRTIPLAATLLLLASCVSVSKKPDLDRLYRSSYLNDTATPLIIIPGLMGTTLVDGQGQEVWPKSVGNLAFSRFDELGADSREDIRPGKLFDGIAGVDFYGTLLDTLEKAGRYEKALPGQAVGSKAKRRYYVFLYDWRRSNFEAVAGLHSLIEQIRRDYRDPALKVDLIAHSNGGLIARYYLQYGPQDGQGRLRPAPWREGDARIRRIAMLGTPNLGSAISIRRLYQGFRIGLRTIPPQVLAYFATPFETLPNPSANVIIDGNGTAVPLDIYDPALWRANKWSIYSDEVVAQIRKEIPDSERKLAELDAHFSRHLLQARLFQDALSRPMPAGRADIALFGGDCNLTLSRAVLETAAGDQRLAFDKDELDEPRRNVDYDALLLLPGDGLVTRESALARAANPYVNPGLPADLFPIAQTTFFCESHELLTANPYFQNNLLYFIFH